MENQIIVGDIMKGVIIFDVKEKKGTQGKV